jgi:Ca2+-binding RTX toxin-like protein
VSHTVTALRHELFQASPDGRILAGGQPCGDATVFNTDAVQAQAAIFPSFVGLFVPGFTAEPTGASEIEISVEQAPDSGMLGVSVLASAGSDKLVVGTGGLNVNGDHDVDIVAPNVSDWILNLGSGNDIATAKGGSGTGLAFTGELSVRGRSGRDAIVIGDADGIGNGGAGADRLIGGAQSEAPQWFQGRGGRDVINAGPRTDYLIGGAGNDKLFAGPGEDFCSDGNAVFRSCEHLI